MKTEALTTPPRYSEATRLSAMENASRTRFEPLRCPVDTAKLAGTIKR